MPWPARGVTKMKAPSRSPMAVCAPSTLTGKFVYVIAPPASVASALDANSSLTCGLAFGSAPASSSPSPSCSTKARSSIYLKAVLAGSSSGNAASTHSRRSPAERAASTLRLAWREREERERGTLTNQRGASGAHARGEQWRGESGARRLGEKGPAVTEIEQEAQMGREGKGRRERERGNSASHSIAVPCDGGYASYF